MDRAFESGASGTPPTPPASPSVGYATDGNPGTGTPATIPGDWWYHMITEEQRAVVVAAGITPDRTNTTQLRDAILALIAAGAANDYKASVRVATTANIASLVGGAPDTVDGILLVLGNRVLVKDQSTGAQNGIYEVTTLGTGANGTWTRATDADTAGELNSGALVPVEEGTVNADTLWMLTTNDPITIGTTALTFSRKDGGGTVEPAMFTLTGGTVSGNAMNVGMASCPMSFRNPTLTNGLPLTIVVPALSGTLPSGATLGAINGQQTTIYELVAYNGGSPVACFVNAAGGVNLDETTLISPTTISGASNSASTIYSLSAVAANSPFRLVGAYTFTQAIAGTYATPASQVQGNGGQALASLASLGYGQKNQDVTGSRAIGTTYYAGPKPRTVQIALTAGTPLIATLTVTPPGGTACTVRGSYSTSGANSYVSAVIPPYNAYLAGGGTAIDSWTEMF
jgi:hypothetical protein